MASGGPRRGAASSKSTTQGTARQEGPPGPNPTVTQAADARANRMAERLLRQVGAELHDGPLQMLAMSVLRLDRVSRFADGDACFQPGKAHQDILFVRDALRDSIQDIRNITAGLNLAEIETSGLAHVVRTAVQRHEARSRLRVTCDLPPWLPDLPPGLKVCVYRVIQEGLNNALRHANGNGLAVSIVTTAGGLELLVRDDGLRTKKASAPSYSGGQGLLCLRDRVEALGGTFSVGSRPEGGTVLCARFMTLPATSGGVGQ